MENDIKRRLNYKKFTAIGIVLITILLIIAYSISNTVKSQEKSKQYLPSQYQTELEENYISSSEAEPVGPLTLEFLDRTFNDFAFVRTISISEASDPYYTCGYVSKDIKEIIDQILWDSGYEDMNQYWTGIDNYWYRYQKGKWEEKFDAFKYPITWIEVPKQDTVPLEYDGGFLIMITSSKELKILKDLKNSTDVNITKKLFFEEKYTYNNGSIIKVSNSRWDNFSTKYVGEYLISSSKEILKKDIITSSELADIMQCESLKIQKINNVDCIKQYAGRIENNLFYDINDYLLGPAINEFISIKVDESMEVNHVYYYYDFQGVLSIVRSAN